MPHPSRTLVTIAAVLVLGAADAGATAQRTFVASSGNDSNPCSLTAPCRGLAAAMAQVSDGGEVVALDSAGYGTFTIAKSVSVTVPSGVYAGITVMSGDGVTINGSGIKVLLRGLIINGLGGYNGVTISNAASVRIEDCQISNLAGGGIYHTSGSLSVANTLVRNNAGIGIWSVGNVNASIERARIEANLDGVRAQNGALVTVHESVITTNANVGAFAFLNDGGVTRQTQVTIARSLLSQNQNGVQARSIVNRGGALLLYAAAVVNDSVLADNRAEGVLATQLNGGVAYITASHSRVSAAYVGGSPISFRVTGGTVGSIDGNCLEGYAWTDTGGFLSTSGNNACGAVMGGATVDPPF
jgi:hypothetical protein